jgi:hypothetical protein
MYDRFFWAGCRIGLRCNTRADRLKLTFNKSMWPAQTAAIFFWGMLKPILKLLPIWISPVTQARFQQLIFYGLLDRNWHPFGKILASDVPRAFALNP